MIIIFDLAIAKSRQTEAVSSVPVSIFLGSSEMWIFHLYE